MRVRGSHDPVHRFVSHNCRGLNDKKKDGIEAYVEWAINGRIYATGLQETWREGTNTESNNGWLLVTHGLKTKICKRGSQGVAILLSPEAKAAWKKAGEEVYTFGERIVAVRLQQKDAKGRKRIIFMVSAYAPTTSSTKEVRDEYKENLQTCLDECRKCEWLILCTDANAALGTKRNKKDEVLGPHGIKRTNDAGDELYQLLARNQLAAASTFFINQSKTGKGRYTTWWHPNRLSRSREFQHDHIIVRKRDMKRVTKAARLPQGGAVESDHWPVLLDMRICSSMATHDRDSESEAKPRIDRGLLQEDGMEERFREAFLNRMEANADEAELTAESIGGKHSYARFADALQDAAKVLETTASRTPGWFTAARDYLNPAIQTRNRRQLEYNAQPTKAKKQSLHAARRAVKIQVRTAINAWHEAVLTKVHTLGAQKGSPEEAAGARRDGRPLSPKDAWEAIKLLGRGRSNTEPIVTMKLKKEDGTVCKDLKETTEVMRKYLGGVFSKNGVFDRSAIDLVKQRRVRHEFDAAPEARELRRAILKMKRWRSGGDARLPAEYFKALLRGDSEESSACMQALVDLYQHFWKTGSYPGDENIRQSEPLRTPKSLSATGLEGVGWRFTFQQLNPKSPVGLSAARYDAYKVATTYEEFLSLGSAHMEGIGRYDSKDAKQKMELLHRDIAWDLKHRFLTITDPLMTPAVEADLDPDSDDGGIVIPEWLTARLKLLPKKGDLGLCKNWRGICLLDIASKILSCVLVERMQSVMEECGMEAQTGFRFLRGTIDGAFNVLMALRKRQEHGKETWACFIDLVKAFDSVPREALFNVLLRFGLPKHFVNIVLRLHTDAVMKFKISDLADDADVDSMIGVRQGSCEGPVLFLFIMQAAMETMTWPVKKPLFYTSEDKCKMTGETPTRKHGALSFEMFASLFADDCAALFETRDDMVVGIDYMIKHLKRFGLLVHVGRGATASKTEAMYFPPPRTLAATGDQSDFTVDDDGFISFVEKFPYLGTNISQNLDSDLDVGIRIAKASQAFGALRQSTFSNKDVKPEMKGRIYVALVLGVLLYGSECWCLRESEFRKLQRFHHDCVRAMCRVNLSHTRRRRISMNTLLDEVGVRQIRWYYETRLLRWVGHVVRMPIDRLPRKMLTAWVPSKRVIGCPRMTYGRTVKKALMNCGIWPRYPKFTAPPGWDFMDAGTQSSLRREHIAAKNAHDKEHAWKWTEKAAEREEWRTLIRGPDPPKRAARPKSTRRPP